jgi:hypothetical protein
MTDERKDPLPKTTLSSFASFFADENQGGGRFKVDKPPTIIVGAAPTPNYPGAGQIDPCGQEFPLGYSVDQMEPVGTAAEVQASIEKLRKPEDDGAA